MPNLYGLRGGGLCGFIISKKLFVQSLLKIIYAFKETILARLCQLKNEKSLLVFRFFARGEHFAPWREGSPCWNCEIREGVGNGDPYGNRTRVTAVKGRCPGPLDERVAERGNIGRLAKLSRKKSQSRPIFNRVFAEGRHAEHRFGVYFGLTAAKFSSPALVFTFSQDCNFATRSAGFWFYRACFEVFSPKISLKNRFICCQERWSAKA